MGGVVFALRPWLFMWLKAIFALARASANVVTCLKRRRVWLAAYPLLALQPRA